jgi:hypothetical protein
MTTTQQTVIQPGAPGTERKIGVIVLYTGQDTYTGEFAPEVPIGTVKRKAMKQFGLEESSADEYALQFEGVDLDDKKKVGDITGHSVTLTLVRIKPQEKGYGRHAD